MNNLLLQYLLFMDLGLGLAGKQITDHCYMVKSGSALPQFNRVMNSGVPTRSEIEKIKQFFGDVKCTWLVNTQDKETEQVLEESGFIYKTNFPAMILNLVNVKPINYDNTIHVRLISFSEISTWISVVAHSFNIDETELAKGLAYLRSSAGDDALKLYIGYYNNVPVAASMIIQHKEIVTVHLVGTLPEYRGKGLGCAVTAEPLLDAQMRGGKQAILLASTMGESLYIKMGFKEYALYNVYSNY